MYQKKATVNAKFKNGNQSITAKLLFNEAGELVNFISNDRFETAGKEFIKNPWSTPVSGYKSFNGHCLAANGKAIYHRPEGDFCYIKMDVKEIDYNLTAFRQ